MYPWIMLMSLVVALVGIMFLSKPVEGFLTVDPQFLKRQRQELQLEGERRYNDIARVQAPASTLSPSSINSAVTQAVPKPTSANSSLLTLVQNSIGLGGQDPGTNKNGPWVEHTGMVQQKITFCESLPLTCDFTDPRMAECGMCHKEGVSSTGAPWRGGMYISSDDQIHANNAAKQSGGNAQYVPTVGTCAAVNFTLMRENCQAREDQLECTHTTAPTANNRCAQCYGSSGPLLFVGAKPKSYSAILHVSHPGTNGTGMVVTTGNQRLTIAPSTNAILDHQEVPLTISEGDTITIVMNGMPKVWCAWLSSSDGKRSISMDVGQQTVSPSDAVGITGDTKSMNVRSAFRSEPGFTEFAKSVPHTVMWYERRETVPGIPISATYGTSRTSGTDVLARVRGIIGNNQNINVPGDVGQTAGASTQHLWLTKDDGRSHIVADGSNLDKRFTYNFVSLVFKVAATLIDPYYQNDIQACPTGPMIYTELGAGLLGANSCFSANGSFNPSLYCLQQLFTGAGGTAAGTLYPRTNAGATALVQKNAQGAPDLDATATFLNNLGDIALYGKTSEGAAVSFADYSDASMKMRGSTPLSFCDGPNKDTGPHTPACLDFLWRTSGSTTTPSRGSIPQYNFCGANGILAPLNADGTPNEDNIANANDKGSVANVKSYYQSIYNAAQNTSNFNSWATSMLNCYNSKVTEPAYNPQSCIKQSLPGINIVEASYGKNCNGGLRGNRTSLFQSLANGQQSFNYTYDYTQTGGDPAGGCGKTLEIVYKCDDGEPKSFTVPPEAGINGQVSLSCAPAAPAPQPPPITLSEHCQRGAGWQRNISRAGTFYAGSDFPGDASYIVVPRGATAELTNVNDQTHTVVGPGEFNFCSMGHMFNDKTKKIVLYSTGYKPV